MTFFLNKTISIFLFSLGIYFWGGTEAKAANAVSICVNTSLQLNIQKDFNVLSNHFDTDKSPDYHTYAFFAIANGHNGLFPPLFKVFWSQRRIGSLPILKFSILSGLSPPSIVS